MYSEIFSINFHIFNNINENIWKIPRISGLHPIEKDLADTQQKIQLYIVGKISLTFSKHFDVFILIVFLWFLGKPECSACLGQVLIKCCIRPLWNMKNLWKIISIQGRSQHSGSGSTFDGSASWMVRGRSPPPRGRRTFENLQNIYEICKSALF